MTRADRLFTFAQSPWRRWLLVMALVLLYSGWTGYVVSQDKPLDFYVYYIAAFGGLPVHRPLQSSRSSLIAYRLSRTTLHAFVLPQVIKLAKRKETAILAKQAGYNLTKLAMSVMLASEVFSRLVKRQAVCSCLKHGDQNRFAHP